MPEGIAWDAARGASSSAASPSARSSPSTRRGKARDFSQPGRRARHRARAGRRRAAPPRSTRSAPTASRTARETERRNAVLRLRPGARPAGRAPRRARGAAAQRRRRRRPTARCTSPTRKPARSSACVPASGASTPFGTPRAARGANGIAVAPDGAVYVTLSTGIGRVDPRDGRLRRLPQPDSVVTGGIDGLYWHEGDLVGVQNSTNPGRVIRIAPRPTAASASTASRCCSRTTIRRSSSRPPARSPAARSTCSPTPTSASTSPTARSKDPDGSAADRRDRGAARSVTRAPRRGATVSAPAGPLRRGRCRRLDLRRLADRAASLGPGRRPGSARAAGRSGRRSARS